MLQYILFFLVLILVLLPLKIIFFSQEFIFVYKYVSISCLYRHSITHLLLNLNMPKG